MTITTSNMTWKLANELEEFDTLLRKLEEEEPIDLNAMFKENTNLPAMINALISFMDESDCIGESLSNQIATLKARKLRFEKRTAAIREVIKHCMERYSINKLECPSGTISYVTRVDSKLTVVDEDALRFEYPEYFIKLDPVLDKKKLSDDLKDGALVVGAFLENTSSIMVRK